LEWKRAADRHPALIFATKEHKKQKVNSLCFSARYIICQQESSEPNQLFGNLKQTRICL